MNLKNMTIGQKLITLGILGTTIPLMITAGIALRQGVAAEKIGIAESEKLSDESQRHILEGVIAMVTSQQEVLEQKASSDLNVARDALAASGGMTFGPEKNVWKARNQLTVVEQTVELPQVKIGAHVVIPNTDLKIASPVVDKVKSLLGSKCTVFQRMNEAGDMLRILTNVENKDGQRAIETYIPSVNPDGAPNPVIRKMLQGERYIGRAFVVNAWYVTAYEPIRDPAGKVVGMLFTGVPEQSARSLREQITRIKVGPTGYVYVLDSKGTYIISKDGKRDGVSIWDSKDVDGRLFVQEIVKKGLALKPGEFAQTRYPWKNEGESQSRRKEVVVAHYAPWDWIIGAGTCEEELRVSARLIQAANRRSMVIMAGTVALCLVGAAVLWGLLSRSITRPIKAVADTLAAGSEQTAYAAGQISAASHSLAEGASEQAASLEETSSSLEEMASMTQKNAEHAQTAKDLAQQTRQAADIGAADMQLMSQAMEAIKGSSSDISKIIKTIDEIAFQTNILALNAAVEAARAGQAGAGFAVVADEVRNLAQRSAQAARETADKIEDAIQKTQQGVQISAKVSLGLQGIVVKVRQVDELIAKVATASREQSQGVEQVNSAVSQMDKVTQTNAANAEECASAATELSAQSSSLKDTVESLSTLVGSQKQMADDDPHRAAKNKSQLPPEGRASHSPSKRVHRRASPQNGQVSDSMHTKSNGRNQFAALEGEFKDF